MGRRCGRCGNGWQGGVVPVFISDNSAGVSFAAGAIFYIGWVSIPCILCTVHLQLSTNHYIYIVYICVENVQDAVKHWTYSS